MNDVTGGQQAWWKGAIVYQIYPRSFCDTNGDGIGDLAGLRSKLDYVEKLGADALWLSPVYPSPDRDYGYDVSDYCDIDPKFGTLAEFGMLVKDLHGRGLKLILDQVLSHTSDQHPWFQESLLSRDNAKKDWYVWAEAKEDGTVPNNWLSAFGGAAWSWHPLRRQYYFHKFLRQQPKLNFHNKDVVKAVMDVLRFWLERGVDGFRLDVANSFVHDEKLTDNPPLPMEERTFLDWAHAPRLQRHIHDANTLENEWSMREVRRVMDEYEGSWAFGEFSEEPKRLPLYAGEPDKLHTGYTFHFLESWSFEPATFRAYYEDVLAAAPDLWPCVTFSNHDVIRTVTRWGGGAGDDELAKLCLLILLTLRGTVLMYQGEELGLPEADLAREDIKDPVGDLYFPFAKGRDGCRTPMPWEEGKPHAGFTSGTPWLPMPESHLTRSVEAQEKDLTSVLHFTRAAIALRKSDAALTWGAIRFEEGPDGVLIYERAYEGEKRRCLFNLTREARRVPAQGEVLFQTGVGSLSEGMLELGALAGVVMKV